MTESWNNRLQECLKKQLEAQPFLDCVESSDIYQTGDIKWRLVRSKSDPLAVNVIASSSQLLPSSVFKIKPSLEHKEWQMWDIQEPSEVTTFATFHETVEAALSKFRDIIESDFARRRRQRNLIRFTEAWRNLPNPREKIMLLNPLTGAPSLFVQPLSLEVSQEVKKAPVDAVNLLPAHVIWVWCESGWPEEAELDTKLADREGYCTDVSALHAMPMLSQVLLERKWLSGRLIAGVVSRTPLYKIGDQPYTVDYLGQDGKGEAVFVQRALDNQGNDLGKWRLVKRVALDKYWPQKPGPDRDVVMTLLKQRDFEEATRALLE